MYCVKSVQIRSYFWSIFSCILTECGHLLRIWTLFTQCMCIFKYSFEENLLSHKLQLNGFSSAWVLIRALLGELRSLLIPYVSHLNGLILLWTSFICHSLTLDYHSWWRIWESINGYFTDTSWYLFPKVSKVIYELEVYPHTQLVEHFRCIQPSFTCLKLTIETLEQGVKYVQN